MIKLQDKFNEIYLNHKLLFQLRHSDAYHFILLVMEYHLNSNKDFYKVHLNIVRHTKVVSKVFIRLNENISKQLNKTISCNNPVQFYYYHFMYNFTSTFKKLVNIVFHIFKMYSHTYNRDKDDGFTYYRVYD